MIPIAAALVVASMVGIWAQRRLLGGRAHDDPLAGAEGLPVRELIIPARALAGLLLAFVLVSVFESYRDAGSEAAAEAGAVLAMAEDAVLLTPDARRDVLGGLRCYARAVAGSDWRAQAEEGGPSPVTDAAADEITASLARASADPRNSVAVSAILSSGSVRVQARIERRSEARPTVPEEIWALLLTTVAVTIGGTAALGHPGVRGRVQLAVLAGTTLVFGLTLLVIHDLDRPYTGPARIEPTAILDVERRMAALPDGDAAPPCDVEGRPR